jgi:excisionase family DNA binding protein
MSVGQNEDPFLTVAEVAELLKLNQQTVRNWIDAGSLPAVRIGRRVRIKREDLDRIVDSGYQAGQRGAVSAGPNADDFWGGELVGAAEPDPAAERPGADASAPESPGSERVDAEQSDADGDGGDQS